MPSKLDSSKAGGVIDMFYTDEREEAKEEEYDYFLDAK